MTNNRAYLGDYQFQEAQALYNGHFDNHLFTKATNGKSSKYANALIDEALAICGSPYHKLSFRRWGKEAMAFLERFV